MPTIEFSRQLTKLRQAASLSQGQLADQLHVSRQAISKWENGTALPDIEKIVQLASILDVSLDELVLAKMPTVNQSTIDKIVTAYAQQSRQDADWRHRPINNFWEFMARYWYVILIFAVFILVSYDIAFH